MAYKSGRQIIHKSEKRRRKIVLNNMHIKARRKKVKYKM